MKQDSCSFRDVESISLRTSLHFRRLPLFVGVFTVWISFGSPNAQACEPILPFIKEVGGPGVLTESWIILLAAVALKCIIFSASQKRLSFVLAFIFMVLGNILTTIIGALVAALIGSGPMPLIGVLIAWPLLIPPAKRLLATTKSAWLKRYSAVKLAGMLALVFLASCILFGISSVFVDSAHPAEYWIIKLIAVYAALIVSLVMTAFWEEWVVWKLTRCPPDYTGYVKPVISANLAVLLCVMFYAAAIALPQRFKSPNFLIGSAGNSMTQDLDFHLQ